LDAARGERRGCKCADPPPFRRNDIRERFVSPSTPRVGRCRPIVEIDDREETRTSNRPYSEAPCPSTMRPRTCGDVRTLSGPNGQRRLGRRRVVNTEDPDAHCREHHAKATAFCTVLGFLSPRRAAPRPSNPPKTASRSIRVQPTNLSPRANHPGYALGAACVLPLPNTLSVLCPPSGALFITPRVTDEQQPAISL